MILQIERPIFRRTFVSFLSPFNPVHKHHLSKRVNIPPNIIFDVVSDVTKYKTFIPFVKDSFITEYHPETKMPCKAGFSIGWHEYDERMICDVSCRKDERVFSKISSSLVFDHLENEWTFDLIEDKTSRSTMTQVNLNLQYRFKNPLLNSLSSIFQSQVSQIMIDSFLKQAIEKQKKANHQ